MTYVIAEAGSNHDGDFEQALELIDVAREAGCDAVKFQLIPPFGRNWLEDLQAYCSHKPSIDFLATPFDVDAVAELDALDVPVPAIKIAAPELVNRELLDAVLRTGRPVILSTGMASMGEIDEALMRLRVIGSVDDDVALLQCTTRYPTPPEQVNLRAMETMRKKFGVPVGLSDHTEGIVIPIAAAALGASVIEKHFTISRELEGPDHPFAVEPHELKAMVQGIRDVEKALGDGRKNGPLEGELVENRGRRLTWVGERVEQQ